MRVSRDQDTKQKKALHGLVRALLANSVRGVTEGFSRELDIVGIGYRAQLAGRKLQMTLGYSHPVEFDIPEGIEIRVDKQTHLVVSGADRQLVGQVAANIRRLRAPRALQGQGHSVLRRDHPPQGGQGRKDGGRLAPAGPAGEDHAERHPEDASGATGEGRGSGHGSAGPPRSPACACSRA